MRKQKKTKSQERQEHFEETYIQTYEDVYQHIRFLTQNKEIAKKLLILTYADFYANMSTDYFGKSNITELLQKKADDIAQLKLGISSEQVRVGHMRKKQKADTLVISSDKEKLDETSVFFEIWDYLKLDEKQDTNRNLSKIRLIGQNVLSILLLCTAIAALVLGADQIKQKIVALRKPFLESLAAEESRKLEEEEKNKKKSIKIAGKLVYLSEVGQVLYSLPLEQTEYASERPENPEIQVGKDGWSYYLPCPEREDSSLSKVSPELFHTLYRMKKEQSEIEIVSREVEDFCIFEDRIYIESFDRIQVVDMEDNFEKVTPGIYIHQENCEFYFCDMLGRAVDKEKDGNIHYGDRIFLMDDDRIDSVVQGEQSKDGYKYELRSVDDSQNGIYRIKSGTEELFIKEDITIDCFCIAGDYLYYSAYIRNGGSGANYSRIFRKSLTEDKKRERMYEEFSGRIWQMYYCQENNQIYGNYIPRNWTNNHGVIVVIDPNGRMSYLEGNEQRTVRETTGNDVLEFVMMRDRQIYCYWKDYQWEKGKEPEILWRDVIVIPDENRTWMNR